MQAHTTAGLRCGVIHQSGNRLQNLLTWTGDRVDRHVRDSRDGLDGAGVGGIGQREGERPGLAGHREADVGPG